VSAPRGKPPASASTVVLDLTRQDADVVAYGVAVAPSAKLRVLALGERGDVLAPALTIDTWVSAGARIDELIAAVATSPRAPTVARTHRSSPPGDIDGLTAREKEVLGELLGGGGAAVIGERLGISEHTVRTHVQNAMAKLGVTSRVEAAAWALRNGLAPAALGENRP